MWMIRGGAAALVMVLAACSATRERGEPATAAGERIETSTATRLSPEPVPPAGIAPVAETETASASPEPVVRVAAKPKPKREPKAGPTPTPAPVARSQPDAKPKPVVRATPDPEPELTPVASNSISGRLELDAGAGQRVAAGEVAQAVVYFLPRSGGARPKPRRFSVDTHSKGFKPALSVVPVGSTVSFPNKDEILHNVFSTTPGSAFDLGTYGPGETRSTKFVKAGLVIVNCNVHNSMRANVLVLSTPYYTRPRADGRFVLDDLPPGPGTLVFWHPRARAQSQAVSGPLKQPVTRQLVASRPSLDSHVH